MRKKGQSFYRGGLVWDAENRLTTVSIVDGDTVHYLYDSQSRRIARTVGTDTTLFVYDAWNVIAECTSSGSPFALSKTYLWGTDLSGTAQGAGGVGGLLTVTDHTGTTPVSHFSTYDGNGNVSDYLDSTGTVAAHFEYDPFGNTIVNTDTTNQFPYRFSTKPIDSTTGLYYYGYRFYDPATSRWPSRDPIEEEGGINLYGFVGNDGVNQFDVLGLAWSDCEKCATDIAKALGHAAAAAVQISVGWRMFGKLQPNMRRGTRGPIKAAIGALAAGVLIEIHNGGNAIREAQISCAKCCGGSPSEKTIKDLQKQIEEHEQTIEDLIRRVEELED